VAHLQVGGVVIWIILVIERVIEPRPDLPTKEGNNPATIRPRIIVAVCENGHGDMRLPRRRPCSVDEVFVGCLESAVDDTIEDLLIHGR
jgi:hypothetical protein